MSDVADILQMRGSPDGSSPALAKSDSKPMKKPKGMSREVFALISASADAAAALASASDAKEAPTTGRKFTIDPGVKPRRWEWAGFHNSARTDGVKLRHWMRKPIVVDDYQFSRFNKPAYVVSYTDDQYEQLLHDSKWTKSQTDVLLRLCRQFDLRWHVIADRWPHRLSREDLGGFEGKILSSRQVARFEIFRGANVRRPASSPGTCKADC